MWWVKFFAVRRPDDPFGLIADINDQFTNDRAIAKSDDRGTRLKPSVDDESGHQPCVQGADVAQAAQTSFTFALVEISLRMEAK